MLSATGEIIVLLARSKRSTEDRGSWGEAGLNTRLRLFWSHFPDVVVALGEDRTFGINAIESALKFLLVFLKLAFPDFNLDNTEHLQASTMTGGDDRRWENCQIR